MNAATIKYYGRNDYFFFFAVNGFAWVGLDIRARLPGYLCGELMEFSAWRLPEHLFVEMQKDGVLVNHNSSCPSKDDLRKIVALHISKMEAFFAACLTECEYDENDILAHLEIYHCFFKGGD